MPLDLGGQPLDGNGRREPGHRRWIDGLLLLLLLELGLGTEEAPAAADGDYGGGGTNAAEG